MRKRIEQLLNGKFEYGVKELRLSENNIDQTVEADSVMSGSFSAASAQSRKVKGFLYSSSPRVSFVPEQFYGVENTIRYQVNAAGLRSGDVIEGSFTLCTDIGEYAVPYCFHVKDEAEPEADAEASGDDQKRAVEVSQELLQLARKDMGAAFALFSSQQFRHRLKAEDPSKELLYNALCAEKCSLSSMEEFLIGSGLKEPVGISLEETGVHLSAAGRTAKYSTLIKTDGWGYLELSVDSDCRFLRLEKKKITTEAFAGGRYELEYIIDTNFLHAGKNFGRIEIRTCYQTLYFEVLAEKPRQRKNGNNGHIQKMMRKQLLELYISLRQGKMEMQSWIDRSLNVISGYRRVGGDDVFADLLLIQLYYADGKRMKAQHLLQDLEHHPQRFTSRDQYAFYLYISTFFQKDSGYVDQVEARIEQMFLQDRQSWIIQWILLYLQERYLKDDSAKLEAICTQLTEGCRSPIMYLEAVTLYRKDPFLLRSMGDVEKRILLFAAKHDMITEELSFQIGNLTLHGENYERRLLTILEHCYQLTGSADILRAICQMLIAGDRKEKSVFCWYERAVDADLRITGLYEYYMETMDDVGIEKMPQIIRMYFTYHNALNYHRKAYIYRNISDNRDNVPQVYQSCRSGIDLFITEQLSLGRIDENLAVLYERFLTRKLLSRSSAQKLSRLLFTFEVTCKNPQMKSVIVVHPDLNEEQVVPLRQGKAKVLLYTPGERILLADEQGQRYASTSLYRAERYLDSPLLTTYCRELCPNQPGLMIYLCEDGKEITEDNLEIFKQACELDVFTPAKRSALRKQVLEYYYSHPEADDRYTWLRSLQLSVYAQADRKKLIAMLTQEGMYEQAFHILEKWGSEHIPIEQMVRICSQSVLQMEYEEHSMLLAYCYQCFTYGKDDDHILNYLLMYYDGPVEDMKRLWVTAHANDMDTMTLEEKILSLILFTHSGSAGSEQIFASYQRKMGRRKICKAYVILKSYEYLILNYPVNDLIFGYIEQGLRKGAEQEDICLLALLRYYSRMRSLDSDREKMIASLLGRYDSMGIRFAFYQNFPRHLRLPLQIEDRVFLEYNADPSHTVYVCYRLEGEKEFVREPMKLSYECIFVREFILFEQEVLECYIEETVKDEVIKTSQKMYLRENVREGMQGSRYDMIGRMSVLEKEGKREELEKQLHSFRQLDEMTKEIFTLL